jgi:hypothetical protein
MTTQVFFSPLQVFDIVCDWEPCDFCIIPKFDNAFSLLDVQVFGVGKAISVIVSIGARVIATACPGKPAVIDWTSATIAVNTPIKVHFLPTATATGKVSKIILYARATDMLSKQIVAHDS